MAFVQWENKEICHGCEKHCSLGYVVFQGHINSSCWPTIGGQQISTYIDKNGTRRGVSAMRTRGTALEMARKIAALCKNHKKTR